MGAMGARRAQGRGRGRRRGRERRGARAERQHRRWDCGNCIGGEEVAATLRASEIRLRGSFRVVSLTLSTLQRCTEGTDVYCLHRAGEGVP